MAIDPLGSTTPTPIPTTSNESEPAEETAETEEPAENSEPTDTVEISGDQPEDSPEEDPPGDSTTDSESSSNSISDAQAADAREARRRRAQARESREDRAESPADTSSSARERSFYLEPGAGTGSEPSRIGNAADEAESETSLADKLADLGIFGASKSVGLFGEQEKSPFAALFGSEPSEKKRLPGLDLYGQRADKKGPGAQFKFSFSIKA